MLAVVPAAAAAQSQPAPVPPTAAVTPDQIVDFSADTVTYDSDADVVTASGEVRMNREGNYLAADQVVWNRKSGEVRASGNVVVLTPQGDKLVGDNVVLTDTLQRRHGRESARRARERRPHRRAARHRARAKSRPSRTRSIRPAR